MVVHMHNELANLVLGPQRLEKFWNWLSKKIETFNVQVLMGDFNMSLFRVIPELRSRGVQIDLGAWYPWKSLEGEPMTDSCGIFFVNLPGVYTLSKNLDHLHDRDATGILARGEPVVSGEPCISRKDFGDGGEEAAADDSAAAETGEDSDESKDDAPKPFGGFDRIEENAGPGMRLGMYLPKNANLTEKFSASLTPTPLAAVAAPNKDRKNDGIKFKEKRLSAKIWRCEGVHQLGSHFPICVFTNNVGRRSPQKLEERRQKQMQRQWRGSQWWPKGSQEGCKARKQDADPQQGRQSRPRGDFLAVAEEWPAVAGENAPDKLARWRMGRRGERDMTCTSGYTSCRQASSDTWGLGWSEAWAVPGAHAWAAVAAAGPIWGPKQWWPTESDGLDNLTPVEAFERLEQTSLPEPAFVQL